MGCYRSLSNFSKRTKAWFSILVHVGHATRATTAYDNCSRVIFIDREYNQRMITFKKFVRKRETTRRERGITTKIFLKRKRENGKEDTRLSTVVYFKHAYIDYIIPLVISYNDFYTFLLRTYIAISNRFRCFEIYKETLLFQLLLLLGTLGH